MGPQSYLSADCWMLRTPDRVRDPVAHTGNSHPFSQECEKRVGHPALFGFQKEGRKRRQRQAHRIRTSVRRMGLGVDASHISHAASDIFLGITVKKFPPESAGRHADPVSQPRHRSEIAHDQDFIPRRSAFAEQRNHAGGRVIAVDPFEAGGIGVELVQGRFASDTPG